MLDGQKKGKLEGACLDKIFSAKRN